MVFVQYEDNFDEKGIFRGNDPLFWVYYPEARPILAKAEVFNFKNGAERRSYDDIFWKRLFASYVYKEENVFDRKITGLRSGNWTLYLNLIGSNVNSLTLKKKLWEY